MLMLLLALNIVLAIIVIAWLHNPPFGYGSAAPWLEGWTLSDKIAAVASVSALLQFIALVVTWWLMKETARRQLRAYVSGGLGKYTDMPVGNWLFVTINNYGTTPAFIGTVNATLIAESELPAIPPEDNPGEFMGYVLPPVHDVEKSYTSQWSVWWKGKRGECVYGRIYYRDIFGKCRSSGFLLRILARNKNEAIPIEAYWAERDEADLGPAARV
jgi:hypothetical protein